MCNFQSALLIAAVIYIRLADTEAENRRTGRIPAQPNRKYATEQLQSPSKPAGSRETAPNTPENQQLRHHLGLIANVAKDDYSENAGKQNEIGYLRTFHKNGAAGYDHYEVFRNKDNAEYDHENHVHMTDKDKIAKNRWDEDQQHFKGRDTEIEEPPSQSAEHHFLFDSNTSRKKKRGHKIASRPSIIKRLSSNGNYSKAQNPYESLCIACGKKKKHLKSNDNKCEAETRGSTKSSDSSNKKRSTTKNWTSPKCSTQNGKLQKLKSHTDSGSGYEVYEYPDEGDKKFVGILLKQPDPVRSQPTLLEPIVVLKKQSANIHPSRIRYEAFVMHDDSPVTGTGYKRSKFESKGLDQGRFAINYHYPTQGISRNEKSGEEKKNERPGDYQDNATDRSNIENPGKDNKSSLAEFHSIVVNVVNNDRNNESYGSSSAENDNATNISNNVVGNHSDEDEGNFNDDIDYVVGGAWHQHQNISKESDVTDESNEEGEEFNSKEDTTVTIEKSAANLNEERNGIIINFDSFENIYDSGKSYVE